MNAKEVYYLWLFYFTIYKWLGFLYNLRFFLMHFRMTSGVGCMPDVFAIVKRENFFYFMVLNYTDF